MQILLYYSTFFKYKIFFCIYQTFLEDSVSYPVKQSLIIFEASENELSASYLP